MTSKPLYFTNMLKLTVMPINLEERIGYLKKLLNKIESERTLIKNIVSSDYNKPDAEIDFTEIIPVVSEIRFVVKNLHKWLRPKRKSRTLLHFNAKASVVFQPKGLVLIIAPWNYPFSLCIGPLISAIAAGNRVIIKPSEFTPNTAELIKKLISDVFPDDVVHVETGGVEVSKKLTSLPFNHIFFTGSPSVGKLVMKAASEHLTSVTLELGGKSPCILDDNFSSESFANRVIWGKFINAGQTCIAPDYILIPETRKQEVVEQLIKKLHERFPDLKIKNQTNCSYTKIVNNSHTKRLAHLLEDAQGKGAKIEYGGEVIEDQSFLSPTILSNVNDSMDVHLEEVFGPILSIYTYTTVDEAIQFIQEKPRPLATYLFSRNSKVIDTFMSRIRTGALVTNDVLSHYVHKNLPFGGVNNSGIGRSHGYYGVKEFSNEMAFLKTGYGPVGADIIKQPYSNRVKSLIDKAVKYL